TVSEPGGAGTGTPITTPCSRSGPQGAAADGPADPPGAAPTRRAIVERFFRQPSAGRHHPDAGAGQPLLRLSASRRPAARAEYSPAGTGAGNDDHRPAADGPQPLRRPATCFSDRSAPLLEAAR